MNVFDQRKYKRKKIDQFLGSYVVDKRGEEHPVNVNDISENGLSFDLMPADSIKIKENDSVQVRFYLTEENYIHLQVKVASVQNIKKQDALRVGVSFRDRGLTDISMYHLIQLIEIIAVLSTENKAAA